MRFANAAPCSPSRAATVRNTAATSADGVTSIHACRYSQAADSASETAFSRPR